VKRFLNDRLPWTDEIKKTTFQTATLTFDHDFAIDLGNREVQIKFLGRGNTAGDTVVYLPKEQIAIVGDLVGYPIPMANDGYPSSGSRLFRTWDSWTPNRLCLDTVQSSTTKRRSSYSATCSSAQRIR